jgi:hypothetical protein
MQLITTLESLMALKFALAGRGRGPISGFRGSHGHRPERPEHPPMAETAQRRQDYPVSSA